LESFHILQSPPNAAGISGLGSIDGVIGSTRAGSWVHLCSFVSGGKGLMNERLISSGTARPMGKRVRREADEIRILTVVGECRLGLKWDIQVR
jgi:hypothetical protein